MTEFDFVKGFSAVSVGLSWCSPVLMRSTWPLSAGLGHFGHLSSSSSLSPVAIPGHGSSLSYLMGSSLSASTAVPAEVVSASDSIGPLAREQSPLAQSPGSERSLLPASLRTAAEELS